MVFNEGEKFFWRREDTVEISAPDDPAMAIRLAEDNFKIVNIYLWIHGVGFTKLFCSAFQNFLTILISVALAVFFNGWALYDRFAKFYEASELQKDLVLETIVDIADITQRIFLYIRRAKIQSIAKRLCVLYASLTSDRKVYFKLKSATILFLYDSLFIGICIAAYVTDVSQPDFELMKNEFWYGIIPPPHAWYISFMRFVFVDWGAATPALSAYFCSMCYMLKEILTKVQRKLETGAACNVEYLSDIYNEITDIISDMNYTFETLFIFGFISISILIFIDFTASIQYGLDSENGIVTIILMCHPFCAFVAVCLFSSSVATAIARLKHAVDFLLVFIAEIVFQQLIFYMKCLIFFYFFFQLIEKLIIYILS